jgi:hypothetical protein
MVRVLIFDAQGTKRLLLIFMGHEHTPHAIEEQFVIEEQLSEQRYTEI